NLIVGSATATQADLGSQLTELGTAYATEVFNPGCPDDPRVGYYSVGGRTQASLFVDPTTTSVVTPFLLSSYTIETALAGPDNDALVSFESARWGDWLGSVPADHLDEVGWFPAVPHPA